MLLCTTLLASNTMTGFNVLNQSAFDDGGKFSFNPIELQDLSKIIFELGFASPDITKLHTIHEGISFDEQIVLANSRGLLGQKITSCKPSSTNGINLSEKFWRPVKEDFRLEHCSADVNTQNKLINQMSRMNPDYYQIFEGSQNRLGQFLIASLLERLTEEILRKAWFNDTSAQTVSNGGNITDGLDIKYFNSFDGIFKQFMSDTDLMSKRYVSITQNSGATPTAQQLTPQQVFDYLTAVYFKSDIRLRKHKSSQFYVTQSIWDGYMMYLEGVEKAGAGNTSTTEEGRTILRFMGKELVVVDVWDRTIEEYYNNGTVSDKPNRIVFSTADNLPIGTLSKGDFSTLDAFYAPYEKLNVIDGAYSIDSKILEDYLVTMAF